MANSGELNKQNQANSAEDSYQGSSRWRIAYIITNVIMVLLLIITAFVAGLGGQMLEAHHIPRYVGSMVLLIEIGILMILGYYQRSYTKRFRFFSVIGGCVAIIEAGLLYIYSGALN